MIMTRSDSLLPLAEVTDRLRVSGHGYAASRWARSSAPSIGHRNSTATFIRSAATRRHGCANSKPPSPMATTQQSVFEVGGAYFVSDGHHRVALAHRRGQEFIGCCLRHSSRAQAVAAGASCATTGSSWTRDGADS
jgi:hypothetical protein